MNRVAKLLPDFNSPLAKSTRSCARAPLRRTASTLLGCLLAVAVFMAPLASAQETEPAPFGPPPAPAPEKPVVAPEVAPPAVAAAGDQEKPLAPAPADPGAKTPAAPAPANSAAEKPADPGAKTPEAPAAPGETEAKNPGEVQLSFKGAKVDVVLKWLGEVTGKTLIKHPKVNVVLNVMSSKPLSRSEAIRLVYQALALQGIVAVESRDAIYLVPEEEAAKIAPEWLDGGEEGRLEGQQFVVLTLRPEHARASKLQEKVKGVLSEKSKIQVDEDANTLVITDRADNVRLARELVQALDVPAVGDVATEIIVLEHAKPDELSPILSSIFGGRSSGRGGERRSPESPQEGGRPSTAGAVRFLAIGGQRLIVTAPKDKLQEIRELITKLDTDTPEDVAVRVIPLTNITAEDLEEDLSSMYRRMRGEGDRQLREVAAHGRSNSLIVLSSQEDFEATQKLVASLDVPEAQANTLKTFPLENADASDLSEQLTDLYAQSGRNRYSDYWGYSSRRRRSGSQENVEFVADRRRNAVIVLAPPSMMEKIGKMISDLDAPVEGTDLVPRIIPLKYVRAYDVEDVLNSLFLRQSSSRRYWDWDEQDQSQNIGRLYGKVRITSETYTNSLIVASNSEENLTAIEEIVAQLDIASPTGETTLRISLNHARAVTVASSINVLFAEGGAGPMRQRQPQQGQERAGPRAQPGGDQNITRGFELEENVAEDAYYPWLTSGRDQGRQTTSGRTIRTGSALVGKVRVVPDHRTNSLLITTNSHLFPDVLKLVDELDIPTAQVLIEAKIIEIASDDRERLGLRFSPDGSRVWDDDDFDDSIIGSGSLDYMRVFSGTTLPGASSTGIIEGALDLDILVQFLRKNSTARIRAEPRINVSNNGLGQVFVGSRIPFIEGSQLSPEGTRNDTFSYIDVGIIFEVSPRINQDNEVTLDIRVEASQERQGETLFGGAIIDTRDYRTDLVANSGQTIVLGGIIQQQEIEVVRKVPYLGDIPLLGWFFKKRDTIIRDIELMVLLQPTVTRSLEEVEELRQEEMTHARRIFEWEAELEETRELELKARAEKKAEEEAEKARQVQEE